MTADLRDTAGGLRLELRVADPSPTPGSDGLAGAAESLDPVDPQWNWRWLIGDFVANVFVPASRGQRERLLIAEPPPVGDPRWDSFLEALAEHLCVHAQLAPPRWLRSRGAEQTPFWWPVHGGLASQRAAALAFSPAAFKRRQILVDGREIPAVPV